MNGYDFCRKILEHPMGGVGKLLEMADCHECDWLEWKASVELTEADKDAGDKPEDLYWSIAKAIISIMNTAGGAVIIGIDDDGRLVPLTENDPHGLVKPEGQANRYDEYKRYYMDKIWNKNGEWIYKKTKIRCDESLPEITPEIYKYKTEEVLVLLVKPRLPLCLTVKKNEKETLLFRIAGEGQTGEVQGFGEMTKYQNDMRKIDVSVPDLEKRYGQFIAQNKQPLIFALQMCCGIVLEVVLLGLLWWSFGWTAGIAAGVFFIAADVLWLLFVQPIFGARPDIQPIPGVKLPGAFIVEYSTT